MMYKILTDEEAVEYADQMIEKVSKAYISTISSYPGVPIEALSEVLFMVNGKDWMSSTDMARARVKANQFFLDKL